MSSQRTPLRTRASFTGPISSTPSNQTTVPRASYTELRPPSRTFRTSSPRVGPLSNSQISQSQSRSRPGSALGTIGSSRPSTPSFTRNHEPYTGTITVSIRPNPHSYNPSQSNAWEVDHFSNTITHTGDLSTFSFDNVFPPRIELTNKEVYDKSCSNIVQNFINNGYNGTVFAYGMTGSGKTFSMKGDVGDPGFVELTIDDIFNKIETDKFHKEYEISVNYLEIYNEKVIDLLEVNNVMNSDLKIRDDPIHGTKIVGISNPIITTKDQLLQLIKKGDNNRKTSATDFNARSSRSHSILQIRLSTIDLINKTEQHATLSLCDLAGSERATSNVERRKEGAFINKSLLALSTVISKLSMMSNGNGNSEHIPYRDSKLTRLLQPALSGSSLISILCTIHLGSATLNQSFVAETYNTLRFATRAKDIIITVEKNSTSKLSDSDSFKIIEELKRTIENQNNEITILKLNTNNDSHNTSPSSSEDYPMIDNSRLSDLEAENRILHEKLEHFTRLTDLQKTETVILKNDTLNDILGSGSHSSQMVMANFEEYYKRVNYEIEEYKGYINHLESQLKHAYEQNATMPPHNNNNNNNNELSKFASKHFEAILKDQEEEILQLKEMLKDKDHIIKGLTKSTKLRRLADSNSANISVVSSGSNNDHQSGPKPIVKMASSMTSPTRSNKENERYLREFNISPRKPKATIDISETNGIKFVI
ncbi:kinesin motor domain-containing protein [Scheffersomyces coipomensis]|uniref:kinesin motor domain-containing protein n=1 Tax=Scheffersomyces coipomensis TaxID=1788519 RepID=UPI00315C9836